MYSTRASDYARVLRASRESLDILPLTPEACDRAVTVQEQLAATSQHRTAKVVDLLIAACAEVNRLTVLHYDKDFDAIAAGHGTADHVGRARRQRPMTGTPYTRHSNAGVAKFGIRTSLRSWRLRA